MLPLTQHVCEVTEAIIYFKGALKVYYYVF